MTDKELCNCAIEALKNSYSPYSGCSVGAALITTDGDLYTGCNIENASFTATVCAERTAFFKAVSEGKRNFSAIAVVGTEKGKISSNFTPCGVCRQVMSEFCRPDFRILVITDKNFEYAEFSLSDLLPYSFTLE